MTSSLPLPILMRSWAVRCFVWAIITIGHSALSVAQNAESPLYWHGFGSVGYGRTDGNTVDVGDRIGNYHNFNFSVALATAPNERLFITAQAAANREGDAMIIDIDYALAEWRISDAFRLRAGRVKQPFGLYTELFHVGTTRPFFNVPQSIYGSAGLVSEGFQGVSVAGARPLAGPLQMEYEMYVGHIDLPYTPPLVAFSDTLLQDATDAVGGRVNLRREGILAGISAYTAHAPHEPTNRRTTIGGEAEYTGSAWLVRSEVVHGSTQDEHVTAGYVETAYHVTPLWQLAVRADGSTTTFQDPIVAAIPDGGLYREGAFSVNYWPMPEFVIKTSIHRIAGRRFSLAEPGVDETIPPGTLPKRLTTLGVLGVQFSF